MVLQTYLVISSLVERLKYSWLPAFNKMLAWMLELNKSLLITWVHSNAEAAVTSLEVPFPSVVKNDPMGFLLLMSNM